MGKTNRKSKPSADTKPNTGILNFDPDNYRLYKLAQHKSDHVKRCASSALWELSINNDSIDTAQEAAMEAISVDGAKDYASGIALNEGPFEKDSQKLKGNWQYRAWTAGWLARAFDEGEEANIQSPNETAGAAGAAGKSKTKTKIVDGELYASFNLADFNHEQLVLVILHTLLLAGIAALKPAIIASRLMGQGNAGTIAQLSANMESMMEYVQAKLTLEKVIPTEEDLDRQGIKVRSLDDDDDEDGTNGSMDAEIQAMLRKLN